MFAPQYEKRFAKAVKAYQAGDAAQATVLLQESSELDIGDKAISDDLLCGLLMVQSGKSDSAIPFLERVVSSSIALPDKLMIKYGINGAIALHVTTNVEVIVPIGSLAAALVLAEAYQSAGRIDDAIGLLQKLHDSSGEAPILLSVCELYAISGEWDEIVEAAAGIRNEDDISLQIRLYQAEALIHEGVHDAASEVLKDCLRSKKRNSELLKEARYMRGQAYLSTGKKAMARKDFAALYADDPGFRDVAQLVKGSSSEGDSQSGADSGGQLL